MYVVEGLARTRGENWCCGVRGGEHVAKNGGENIQKIVARTFFFEKMNTHLAIPSCENAKFKKLEQKEMFAVQEVSEKKTTNCLSGCAGGAKQKALESSKKNPWREFWGDGRPGTLGESPAVSRESDGSAWKPLESLRKPGESIGESRESAGECCVLEMTRG